MNLQVAWDGEKYRIALEPESIMVVPFPEAGRLTYRETEILQETEIHVAKEQGSTTENDISKCLVFYPVSTEGVLDWVIETEADGSRAVAKVTHEQPGGYTLPEQLLVTDKLILHKHVQWEISAKLGSQRTAAQLRKEIEDKGIKFGIKPRVWQEFLAVDGQKEIIIAEAKPPVSPQPPVIIDYVETIRDQVDNEQRHINFFASKIRICQKDELLAKKIPGKQGKAGFDIFGNLLPAAELTELTFQTEKNVYLNEEGTEIRAACAGKPVRINAYTYAVEEVYRIDHDVNLATGSIDFPGNVDVRGNVNDGLFIRADGHINIAGGVSGAELKSEAGVTVNGNIISSTIVIGEKHSYRLRFSKALQDFYEDLTVCIAQVEQLQTVSMQTKVGQLLKVVLEKKYPFLGTKSEELEQLLKPEDPEFFSKELEVVVRTLKHFLAGLGPARLEDLKHLKKAIKVMEVFLATKANMLPLQVRCEVNYIQKTDIDCAGDFICRNGLYNSFVKAGGDVKIWGVCRGGEISAAGNISIMELGGPAGSSTIVKASKSSRVSVEYCHGNARVYLGKEVISLDQSLRKIEIYREKGLLQYEKLKWDGHNIKHK